MILIWTLCLKTKRLGPEKKGNEDEQKEEKK
jgi:hypothetical protein